MRWTLRVAEPGGPATAAQGEKLDVIESMTQIYTKGIERLAEIQKKGLEICRSAQCGAGQHMEETDTGRTWLFDARSGEHGV